METINPFNLKQTAADKLSVVDARARDASDIIVNVEVQTYSHKALGPRGLYYWARSYGSQLHDGELYAKLRPVVGVTILDFVHWKSRQRSHHLFQIRETTEPDFPYDDHLSLHVVELGKGTDRLSTALRNWCYPLQHAGENEPMMSEIKRTDEAIAEADARYRAFIADEAARADLLERDRWRRDLAQRIHDAHEDGVEEGVERGRDEGRREGIATIAQQMKSRGMDDALIAELTGIPIEQVREL